MRSAWLRALAVYLDRRVLAIFFLGFASGLPLLLGLSTLSAWLSEEGVSKTTIGLFSWAGSFYTFKYLWSPLVDRLRLPWLTRKLGRRRGWLLVSQLAVIVAILGLGSTHPGQDLFATAIWTVVLAFTSATQDIVIDAYRVEILDESQLGAGAATVVFGYRVGMLAAGAGTLIVADLAGWHAAYMTMAALMGVGMVTVLLNPEPPGAAADALAEEANALATPAEKAVAWLNGAVIAPFKEFMTRPGWLVILLFVIFYKYADALLGVMANPFYLEMGFTKTEIAILSKSYGLVMTLVGVFIGGVLVARAGILRSLLLAGVLQGASNLIFAWQATMGHSEPALALTISVENLCGGMATAVFVAYLSSLCNVAYTATQYALLSSFSAFARTLFSAGAGWLADHMSWVSFWIVTTLAALPGLMLLVWMMRRFPSTGPPEAEMLPEPE